MKIIKRKDNEKLFSSFWRDYQENNVTGPYYSPDTIEYHVVTEKEFLVSDESFVFVNEEVCPKCLGVCFFPVYSKEGVVYSNSLAPLASTSKYLDSCFEYIDTLVDEHQISKIELHIDVCYSQYGEWKYNYLRDYGYIDCTINDSVFMLDSSAEDLFYKLNKSSRRLVRKALASNDCELKVYDKDSITADVFNNYKNYHFICAGEQTRTDESFDYMLTLIQNSKAALLELNYLGRSVGYLLVFLSHPYVSLSSIANLPQYEREVPIYRLLYWKAIEYFSSDYDVLLYGYPAGNSLIEGFKSYMDEKQLKIAKYKSYMGGMTVPHFRGVRYFDKSLMLQDVSIFKEIMESSYE